MIFQNKSINLIVKGIKKSVDSISQLYYSVKCRIRHLFHIRWTRSFSGNLINITALALLSAVMLIPMLYVINNAFKPLNELFIFPPKIFVQNPTLDNLHDLVSIMGNSWIPVSRYLFNTVFITVAGTAFHVVFASMAAYVLEKHRFPGAKLFFALVITTLMFSPIITMIPNFIIMSKLKMIDTYFSVIIPAIGSPLGLFLMKQFMSTVPDTILEAAKIDGAGEFKVFFSIVMPVVRPAWLTLIIFSTQALWNSSGNIFIRSEALKPLPYALTQIMTGGVARAGVGSAVGLLLMIVPVTVFLSCQNQIIDTMATSGMKE